jgi:hypothetical protein
MTCAKKCAVRGNNSSSSPFGIMVFSKEHGALEAFVAARLALRWRGIARHISWRFLPAAWSQHLGQDQ